MATICRWERPTEKFAAVHEARLQKANAEVDDAVGVSSATRNHVMC
jgi:hypothetical protein